MRAKTLPAAAASQVSLACNLVSGGLRAWVGERRDDFLVSKLAANCIRTACTLAAHGTWYGARVF